MTNKTNKVQSKWDEWKATHNINEGNSSIGFAGFLTILFIGLKLTNYINWSWWWVLSPLWISFIFALIIIIIVYNLVK